ncbi:MAG: hypothetical protein U0792_25015 [Gemmataceae bacterium]
MSTITGITACFVGNLLFTLAPIPHEPPPDPMARGYMGITVQTGGLAIENAALGPPAASWAASWRCARSRWHTGVA